MAKETKRTRKLNAKGGIKALIGKGTVTKKGKIRGHASRKTREKTKEDALKDRKERKQRGEEASLENEKKRNETRDEEDFTGEENLGDLDIESFFESKAEEEEEEEEEATPEEKEADGDDMKQGDSDSDGSEDEDEGDLDMAEDAMRLEMENLAAKDPEFHNFLKDQDKDLLTFGKAEDTAMEVDEEEEDEEEEEEEEEKSAGKKKTKVTKAKVVADKDGSSIRLTLPLLLSYEKRAFECHGLKSLKQIIAAYRCACHIGDDTNDAVQSSRRRYIMDDPEVFDRLMMVTLTKCHSAFDYHLLGDGAVAVVNAKKKKSTSEKEADKEESEDEKEELDENKPLNPKKLHQARRFTDVSIILQSFFQSTIHLLFSSKEPQLLTILLKRLSVYIPYLSPFPKLATKLLKTLIKHFFYPSSQSSSASHHTLRLQAFLRIRQMTLTQPFPFIEEALKATYLAYAKSAKFATNENTLPTLTFQGNCLVELYSLDIDSSYQHAFVYIRQLALLLRKAIQKKTKDSLNGVYCWQYMHCLKLWVAILSETCSPHEDNNVMGDLIYPLVQVIWGTIKLLPNSTRYLPLHLHCVRFLQQLAAASEKFIPVSSVLFSVLDNNAIYQKPKKFVRSSSGRKKSSDTLRLPLILKLPPQDALRTKEQLEMILGEVFVLFGRECDLYRYSAGYPEFSLRICARLRKFCKDMKDPRYRAFAKGSIETCEKYSTYGKQKRSTLPLAPKDIARLEVLKPDEAPGMKKRYDDAISKEKRLIIAAAPVMKEKVVKEKKNEKDAEKNRDVEDKKEKQEKSAPKVVGNLEEDDEVQEGIDWSDAEEEEDMEEADSE